MFLLLLLAVGTASALEEEVVSLTLSHPAQSVSVTPLEGGWMGQGVGEGTEWIFEFRRDYEVRVTFSDGENTEIVTVAGDEVFQDDEDEKTVTKGDHELTFREWRPQALTGGEGTTPESQPSPHETLDQASKERGKKRGESKEYPCSIMSNDGNRDTEHVGKAAVQFKLHNIKNDMVKFQIKYFANESAQAEDDYAEYGAMEKYHFSTIGFRDEGYLEVTTEKKDKDGVWEEVGVSRLRVWQLLMIRSFVAEVGSPTYYLKAKTHWDPEKRFQVSISGNFPPDTYTVRIPKADVLKYKYPDSIKPKTGFGEDPPWSIFEFGMEELDGKTVVFKAGSYSVNVNKMEVIKTVDWNTKKSVTINGKNNCLQAHMTLERPFEKQIRAGSRKRMRVNSFIYDKTVEINWNYKDGVEGLLALEAIVEQLSRISTKVAFIGKGTTHVYESTAEMPAILKTEPLVHHGQALLKNHFGSKREIADPHVFRRIKKAENPEPLGKMFAKDEKVIVVVVGEDDAQQKELPTNLWAEIKSLARWQAPVIVVDVGKIPYRKVLVHNEVVWIATALFPREPAVFMAHVLDAALSRVPYQLARNGNKIKTERWILRHAEIFVQKMKGLGHMMGNGVKGIMSLIMGNEENEGTTKEAVDEREMRTDEGTP